MENAQLEALINMLALEQEIAAAAVEAEVLEAAVKATPNPALNCLKHLLIDNTQNMLLIKPKKKEKYSLHQNYNRHIKQCCTIT